MKLPLLLTTVIAAGGIPAIGVFASDGTTAIANGDASPSVGDGTDFGTTPVGTTVTKTFTIKNTGTTPLSVTAISVPSGYTQLTTPPLTINPAASTTFQVRVDAATRNTFAGNVTITSNSPTNSSYVFAITAFVKYADLALPASAWTARWYAGNGDDIPANVLASGGGAISDTARIATWTDLTNTYSPAQGTDGSRPTWAQSDALFAGHSSAIGDGGDSLSLSVTANDVPRAKNSLTLVTMYLVFQTTSTTDSVLYSEGKLVGVTPISIARLNRTSAGTGSGQLRASDATNAVVTTSAAAAYNDGLAHLMSVSYDNAQTPKHNIYKDGGASLANDSDDLSAKTFDMDRIALFADITNGVVLLNFTGRIAFIGIDAAAQDANIVTALKTYYGIP